MDCLHVKTDGSLCRAKALPDSQYCWNHDPDKEEARKAARSKGGANSAAIVRLQKALPPALKMVYSKLEKALSDVLDSSLPPARGQAAAAIARALCAVLETGELAEKVALLEARLADQENER